MNPDFAPALSRESTLRRLAHAFAEAGLPDARSDARFLALHALALTPLDLTLRGREPLGEAGARALGDAAARRLAGEPVARIVGAWEFWGLPFALGPETLVPRPDTESAVEAALRLFPEREQPLRLIDLGTGSGCILVALLSERPNAVGVGVDRAEGALALARRNAETNGVGARALFLRGSWLDALKGPFDLIVSNPPYIAAGVIPTLDAEVRLHDPHAALDGGADGLDAYRAILSGLVRRPGLLSAGGAVVLEIGFDQAEALTGLARSMGWADVSVGRDLAGNDRVVTLRPSFTGR